MFTSNWSLQPTAQQRVLIIERDVATAQDLQQILEKAGGYVVTQLHPAEVSALELLLQERPDVVLLDLDLNGPRKGNELGRQLTEAHIPVVYLAATADSSERDANKFSHAYDCLTKPVREIDVLVALKIAQYRHLHGEEERIRNEQALQIRLINAFSSGEGWSKRLLDIAREFQSFIPFDYIIMGLEKEQALNAFRSCSFFRVGLDEYQTIWADDFFRMNNITLQQYQLIRAQAPANHLAFYNGNEFKELCRTNPLKRLIAKTFRLKSNMMLPLQTAHNGDFNISFFSRQANGFQLQHLRLAQQLQPSLTITVDRLMAFDRIEQLSEQLRQENSYLLEEVKTSANFEEIIGESPLLTKVFEALNQVSPTDYTVLILGETGTGKELIARAVHNRSKRRTKALIKVNCAALPPQLIESELFGHEKGSFTGATEKRIGKFELAHNGTIFLDEIGEMPLELQTKLLRVLQEKEIERIGGSGTIPCDVRIIAATNRNLQQEVSEGRFRADLYYRLNVFPIHLPPLRERKEDLPALITFFLHRIAKKLGKKLAGISDASLQQMQTYHWPGNIRELEHLLERAAIMAPGPVVSLVEPLAAEPAPNGLSAVVTIVKPHKQAERENVMAALQQANYRIRGQKGAAELLNIKPTTLEAKIARLGISRQP
ncbi:sigma-54-dependent Fis family transcriptional regulator [Hymenobacter sp. 15J16-1T3B]|uniref:sigma-54 dependent transcriptional regulator n=1 Tax=Hymenobacter sp. 15J16-1T3B TaxID=2886941 RepID=UPI001D11765E|nr:sigma-54-dependent Fis family transcriptional regulator [Hymenobacter sp. 15J16-1T3B]MCC3158442.1 sigma-54-dependent Fis family transcriptional regulator [Hymenobacter sp. 15J16-1T3B]